MSDARQTRRKARTRYERYTTRVDSDTPATCHFERPRYSGGLCVYCYNQQYKKQWRRARTSQDFGVDTETYRVLVAVGCPICTKSFEETKREPGFDHNHVTGKFRGLLCQACNRGIGFLRDSQDVALAAAAYLAKDGEFPSLPTTS